MGPRYDGRTALIVVDVQNDFADPAGSLYVRGGEAVVEAANREIAAATAAGALVVYTQDWHPEVTPTSPRTAASGRCTAWSGPGAPQLHPRLARGRAPRGVKVGSAGRTATRGSPCGESTPARRLSTRAGGPAARPGRRAGGRGRTGDRLLRQGDGPRRRSPGLRHDRDRRRRRLRSIWSRATASRALEQIREAGADVV